MAVSPTGNSVDHIRDGGRRPHSFTQMPDATGLQRDYYYYYYFYTPGSINPAGFKQEANKKQKNKYHWRL